MEIRLTNNRVQHFICSVVFFLKVVVIFAIPTSVLAEDLEAQYFTAHQVAQMHNVAELLIDEANPSIVDLVVKDLISYHVQADVIRTYQNSKEVNYSLREEIKDVLLSAEFSSWLNEKIASTYAKEYSYEQLKLMYQAVKNNQDMGFGEYLKEYVQNQDVKQALVSMRKELLLKELEQRIGEQLDKLPKPKKE